MTEEKVFWYPLVTQVEQPRSVGDDFLLRAFFVDYPGQATTWKIELHDFFTDEKIIAPVRFPVINKFSSDDLISWLQDYYVYFPEDLQARIDIGLDTIVQASEDGVPDRVIEYLCGICDFELEDIEEWLRT